MSSLPRFNRPILLGTTLWLSAAIIVSLPLQVAAQPMPGGAGASQGPVSVGVVEMKATTVPVTTELPGRVAASATAEIRPQVGGIIKNVAFKEGSPVKQGDVLYEIDAASFDAEVAVAQAALDKVAALVPTAQDKVTRYESLTASGGISQTDLADARVALAQAQADVASAQANLNVATINLAFTTITAPIAGIIGTSSITQGALVTANQTDALATIRQLEPVFVDMAESSSNLLRLRTDLAANQAATGAPLTPPVVKLTLETGTPYAQEGTVSLADPFVSETTGSFTIRATMPNPNRLLLPGMFVRANVTLYQQANAFLVPQRAVTFNAEGKPTAFFVSADNKATVQILTTDRALGNAWVVSAGVADGDKLIVDGLQKVSAGVDVIPLPVTIDDNGVILQTIEAAPAAEVAK